jgi:peptide/nickel transport system substrate-binding protein
MTFSENPDIAELNAQITNNPDLPPVADRLPEEPLVVQPYDQIGVYGGVLDCMSIATEAGTSHVLSVRHVNMVRLSDDLQTVVPNIAKGWEWNDDFTELTFFLRKGHKWSDGEPFTAYDVEFWYNDLVLNKEIFPETPSWWLYADEPAQVEAVDETTVKFIFPIPSPGSIYKFAVMYIQPFQPKHFFEQYHITYNPDANDLAAAEGLDSWVDLVNRFYGASDWKDVPSPLLSGAADFVVPTLESHIVVEETPEFRRVVANPYFHMVDTQGNQLPYINEINEIYVPDSEVRNLKITNGEIDYKDQTLYIEDYTLYKENEANGNYTVDLPFGVGELVFYGFNMTHPDEGLREIFGDVRFRQAMSLAIDREEIVEIVYLGQAEPRQATPADPNTVTFVTEDQLTSFIEYDPARANALLDDMGLVDTDGDGFRERLDGSNLTLLLQYTMQGGPIRIHELTRDYWADIGIRVDIKEIGTDEYRELANENNVDLTFWRLDSSAGVSIVQSPFQLRPPFGYYFNAGNALLWHEWKTTGGASGIEPPEDVKKLYDLVDEFLQYELGSEESNRIGHEIVDIHVNNLWKIGIAGNASTPVVHHNNLKNWGPYPVKGYDYYWAYQYRPNQWFLTE